MHIIVIGGGIIGTLSAYYLYRQGYRVTLVEKSRDLAAGASGMNGGQLSYAYVSPLGNPGIYRLAAQAVAGRMEDVKITRWLDPQLWRWGAGLILRQSSQDRYKANQARLLELSLESRALMGRFLQEHPLSFHRNTNGKLHLYVSRAQQDTARAMAVDLRARGLRQDILDTEECLALEPSLTGRTGSFAGGMFSHDDEAGDCGDFTRALCEDVLRPHIAILAGTPVERIMTLRGRVQGVETAAGDRLMADAVMVCAGIASRRILKTAGICLPLYPVKGYSTQFPMRGVDLQRSVTDHQRRLVFTPLGDQVRVAGLMHFSGCDLTVSAATQAHLARAIHDVFPSADVSNLRFAAGLRPYLPDSVPLVAPSATRGLFINTGHAMLGWTLAHATARRAAEMVAQTHIQSM